MNFDEVVKPKRAKVEVTWPLTSRRKEEFPHRIKVSLRLFRIVPPMWTWNFTQSELERLNEFKQ